MDLLVPHPVAPWWHHQFARWTNGIDGSGPSIDVGRAAYALSGHGSQLARRAEDELAVLAEIGDLADGLATIDAWHQRLFVDFALTGNGADYHDARNSFLPDVLARRLGLPITLALVGRLVAEAAGLVAWGIGFPGHFLLGIAPSGGRWGDWTAPGARIIDAFNGGQIMTADDAVDRFHTMFGANHRFDHSMLGPVSNAQLLVRMLNNLKSNYAREKHLFGLCAVARLRTCLPDWSLDEGRELVRLLTAASALDEASSVLDELDRRFAADDEILAAERSRLAASLN